MTCDDLIGIPYVRGGRFPGRGLDCFGLVVECCLRAGRPIPDPFHSGVLDGSTRDWILTRLAGWRRCDEPAPGCVVEFRGSHGLPAHVGYLITSMEFLHTLSKTGCIRSRLDRDPWPARMIGVYAYCG